MPLIISRGINDELDLGDPRSPTLRVRILAIRPDPPSVDLSLHPLKPIRITPHEDVDPSATPPLRDQPLTITRGVSGGAAPSQSIICGDPRHPLVTISIAAVKDNRVRISLDAQPFFEVHRREVAEMIRAEELP